MGGMNPKLTSIPIRCLLGSLDLSEIDVFELIATYFKNGCFGYHPPQPTAYSSPISPASVPPIYASLNDYENCLKTLKIQPTAS